jgi:hypothetical protein
VLWLADRCRDQLLKTGLLTLPAVLVGLLVTSAPDALEQLAWVGR